MTFQTVSLFDHVAPTWRCDPDWRPPTPPRLDAVRDIIINFETTGFEWWGADEPVGVTVASLDGSIPPHYLPTGHTDGNLPKEQVIAYLKSIRGKHITNAKTKFDVHFARKWGVDFEAQNCTVSDVQHYAALCDDHRKRFAIDELAEDLLGGVRVPRLDESRMATYSAQMVTPRAEYQAVLVRQLRDHFWPQLDAEDLQRVRQLEDELIYSVVEMEQNGSPIDEEMLAQWEVETRSMYEGLLREISQEVGFPFNDKTGDWIRLFERYAIPLQYLSDEHEARGKPTFADDVTRSIKHPVIKKARLAGQIADLRSKSILKYPQHIYNGILRYELKQLASEKGGTVSGRFSATNGVHQVPNRDHHAEVFGKDLAYWPRKLFIPAVGQSLSSDAAQIELRYLVHAAKIQKMIDGYKADPKVSFHRMMEKQLAPLISISYTNTKQLTFTKMYGGKTIRIAIDLGFITEAEGREIRKAERWDDERLAPVRKIEEMYKRALPEADAILERASHLAKTRGWVKTMLGRRSRFPNGYRAHKAWNAVCQGSCGDIMKRKIIELHAERKATGFIMRKTVHDSVDGDSPDKKCAAMVDEILNRQSFDLRVPILWDTKVGPNWAECA